MWQIFSVPHILQFTSGDFRQKIYEKYVKYQNLRDEEKICEIAQDYRVLASLPLA